MFNTPLGPVAAQQDQQHITACDILPVEMVIEGIAASTG